jgi:hypothetical protein
LHPRMFLTFVSMSKTDNWNFSFILKLSFSVFFLVFLFILYLCL